MVTQHVHAVVVGSGFGGSVAAYRLAAAEKSVVVLERGRAYPPGSFPRTPHEMGQAFWDPGERQFGLFDVWRFTGFDSLVASGLGGGSLIYANVLLRKDEKWFVHDEPVPGGGYENWPVTRADLDPHYDAVERMLGANPYPLHAPAFWDTPKTHAMIMAAEQNGLSWQLPPLAISFSPSPGGEPGVGLPIVPPEYGNLHGVPRRTCRLVGECDIGCNDGAKNTLDHTYLSAAHHHGADIRTGCEVRSLRPLDAGGYEVAYLRRDPDGHEPDDTLTITCDRLILAAGTYGTTYLLLRNRAALPGLGATLGTRFSGSGDLLTFLLPHGRTAKTETFAASHGPVTTAAIRVPDTLDGDPTGAAGTGRGFYISDGGYPGFVDWLVDSGDLTGTAFRLGELVVRWAFDRVTRSRPSHFTADMASLLGKGTLAAGSLPLLGLGRDIPDGLMKLRDGHLDVEWTDATSLEYVSRMRDTMRQVAATLDVEYLDNPSGFFKRILTVHPVGGAPMGRGDADGVCDSFGEVFHHPGLYVADGSAMPGPVGANPSLTIAAHADRLASHILDQPVRHAAPVKSTVRSVSPKSAAGRSGAARPPTRPAPAASTVAGSVVAGSAVAGSGGTKSGPATSVPATSVPPRSVPARSVPATSVPAGPAPAKVVPARSVPARANAKKSTATGGTSQPTTKAAAALATAGAVTVADALAAPLRVHARRSSTSLSFTERMAGFFAFDADDPVTGERAGRARDQRLTFQVTITATDVDTFLASPAHLATAQGWIEADALGGRLPVTRGWFNLFTPGEAVHSRRMEYRLHFADATGHPLTLVGRKEVRDNSILDLWPDSSTLYYHLHPGHVAGEGAGTAEMAGGGAAGSAGGGGAAGSAGGGGAAGSAGGGGAAGSAGGGGAAVVATGAADPAAAQAAVCGAGVAHIRIEDFAHQLTTIRTDGPDHRAALLHFGQFFLGQLWDVYGRHVGPVPVGA
ncbi:MAG: cholesterol oxidase [Micromonosporaceae bacterium]|nr:cholesterol oxidase [Micromonosporaceae bacterium]